MPRVCLCLIVRDESTVIERCLNSVLPYVDLLYVSDTGSVDDTEEKIFACADKYHKPSRVGGDMWVDFAHNRNLALAGARKFLEETSPGSDSYLDDYIMVMDADDVLRNPECLPGNVLRWTSPKNADGYMATYHLGDLEFSRPILIKAGASWQYYFPVHELLLRCEGDSLAGVHDSGLVVDCNVGGAFQGREHFLAHAEILESYLAEHPDCSRSQFYLGQSYHCAGENDKALRAYAKRTQMAGWEEEKLVAWLRVGELANDPGAYLEAAALNGSRVEGLYGAAMWCESKGLRAPALGLMLAAVDRLKGGKPGGLFVDSDIPRRIQLLHKELKT